MAHLYDDERFALALQRQLLSASALVGRSPHVYGKEVASLVGGANERFAAAAAPTPARPVVAGADSRFAAGVRAQEPMCRLKPELRSVADPCQGTPKRCRARGRPQAQCSS